MKSDFTLAQVLKISTFITKIRNFKSAFTLTEVLLATVIVGVLAGLVLPTVISRAQDKGFDQAYDRNVNTIAQAVEALPIVENKDFFKSAMYSDTTPENYDTTSGEFIKKYLKVARYCGSGDNKKLCFSSVYFQFNGNKKEIYNPDFIGACAKLKNGASICLQPQIGAARPKGIIDLNGTSGPNVLNRDLREFTLAAKTQIGKDKTISDVFVTTAPDLGLSNNPCTDPTSLACCSSKDITSSSDPCCSIDEIYNTNSVCKPVETDPCESDPKGLACCQKTGVTNDNKAWCCTFDALKSNSKCTEKKYLTVYVHDTHNGYADNHYEAELWDDHPTKMHVATKYIAPQKITVSFYKNQLGYSDKISCVINKGENKCGAFPADNQIHPEFSEPWMMPKATDIKVDYVPPGYEMVTSNTYGKVLK